MISHTESVNCPIPISDYPRITLAHGGGGSLTATLIDKIFTAVFKDPILDERHDGAQLPSYRNRVAMSTDTHVVNPLFFPGGDIGKLSVYGTVNDIAMCAARPEFLSVGFVLEEGLPVETLWQVVLSMKEAADRANVRIVTGDTKVVEHGKGDGIYINTTGIGPILYPALFGPKAIREGDLVLLCGDIGRHGVAVMAAREGLAFETSIESDCAPLNHMVEALFKEGLTINCLRDLTRGGLATCLVELAHTSGLTIEVEESSIPVEPEVAAACELLGLDPLYVANEGRCIAILPAPEAQTALTIMHTFQPGLRARVIGRVMQPDGPAEAILRTPLGTQRLLTLFSGEQLPRIC